MSFHDTTAKEVLQELKASEKGLYSTDAKLRLEKYGPNAIAGKKGPSVLALFLEQFNNPVVWVLLVALGVAFFLKEYTDFTVILVLVIINAILGVIQEYRAEKAIEALKKLTALKAKALRDGKETLIDAADLVPGDIIMLETGDRVPADCRLLDIVNFQTLESALTGESTPVSKKLEPVAAKAQVADRKCMAFSGTVVTAGRAKAVVVATGGKTELGNIAKMIDEAEPEDTPLQKKLAGLSVWITVLVVGIAIVVFVTGLLEGKPFLQFLLEAVALAVAAIPEGLPAIVTIELALGVRIMAARNALIRKLPSAETLGACNVICSDKTGTLTRNEMTVRKIYVDGTVIDVSGSGYAPEGKFSDEAKDLELLLTIGALNNNSRVAETGNSWAVFGDPTEGALVVSARKFGIKTDALAKKLPRIGEIEFTSERKRMTTFHKHGTVVAYVKGASDLILERSTHTLLHGKKVALTPELRKQATAVIEQFASDALRILGFAYREAGKDRSEKVEKDLIFVGFQAMIDPPRDEVAQAISECKTAGIKVVMITGDHPATAQAIAKELGITGAMMTGMDLEKVADLNSHVDNIGIYARVNPEHKMKIVDALQKRGYVVAMTGDGVNDAPALKKADIGIAMGIAGTDVAKEASAMVLADDNFASIVSAVREGRRIFDNIRKFILYLLSSNVGEVLIIFGALILGMPLPLLPVHLLWINLVTDGLPALALGILPPEKDTMERPPKSTKEGIMTRRNSIELWTIGLVMAGTALYIFTQYPNDLIRGQTVVFMAVIMQEMFNVLNYQSDHSALVSKGSKWVWLAIASSIALSLIVVYTPALDVIFDSVPLNGHDWLLVMGAGLAVFFTGELLKIIYPRHKN
ncbi:MAG TPA: calcium-translocating P-type ATPase, SERCA-type [Candidatus Binatia bacterium]|nr:calcium-translocating P-type ATPase, SERCA-type [Candidatus Binatia bacterium]